MNYLLTIVTFLFLSSSLFGQKKGKKKAELKYCAGVTIVKKFKVGDSLITCNTCHWDECGNVVNTKSDTLYKNNGIVHPSFHPVFLTIDSILLTKNQILSLIKENKIRHMQFLHCNEVAQRMGFIALEGLYLVELKDTTIQYQPLLDAVRTKFKNNAILNSQLLVNGYRIKSDNLKSTKFEDLEIEFLEKSNLYCVLTE